MSDKIQFEVNGVDPGNLTDSWRQRVAVVAPKLALDAVDVKRVSGEVARFAFLIIGHEPDIGIRKCDYADAYELRLDEETGKRLAAALTKRFG